MTLINRTKNSIRTILAGAVLMAIPVLAVAVHAADCVATFTLPYEVHWNKTVLPAGEYTMKFKSAGGTAFIRSTHGTRSYVITLPTVDQSNEENAGLQVTSAAGQHMVRAMNLPQLGVRIVFNPIPKSEREELAKAGQIESLPVTAQK
jgi:hypothetical protein